jgi:segregation and condensation protein B
MTQQETDKPTDTQAPDQADHAQPSRGVELSVEAVLMTVDRPIPTSRIAELLELDSAKPVSAAIKSLNTFYEQHERSFRIEQVAGGYQILTLPRFKSLLSGLHRTRGDNKLSPAAMETLAIIAYRQPVLRADIEAIRGVACGEVVRSLMDKHLVKITGRAEEIGRPMLYGTTRRFLEVFGLSSLKDLPKNEELVRP